MTHGHGQGQYGDSFREGKGWGYMEVGKGEKAGTALAGVAQWIEYQPGNQRVADLGHMPGLCARSPVGGM